MAFEVQVTSYLTPDEKEILRKNGPRGFYDCKWFADSEKTVSRVHFSEKELKETSKKRQIHQLLADQNIEDATWNYSENLVTFTVRFFVYGANKMDIIMEDLRFKGFGSLDYSSIHVHESTAYFCDGQNRQTVKSQSNINDKATLFRDFFNSVKSRMTVVQIYQSVKDRGRITFDYLCFLITAAGIATVSLSTNNYPGIVASMLLSPLLNPILAFLFGIILRQKQLITEGLKNLTISIIITLVVGFIFGMVCHYINFIEKVNYPTSLMMDKSKYVYILSILTFAIVSAPNLSTALLSNNSSAQIGNAISLSLLPPIVNTGFLWFLSLISAIDKKTDSFNGTTKCNYSWLAKDHKMIYFDGTCNLSLDFLVGGIFSFFISLLNIAIIVFIGYFVFKLKGLASNHLLQEDTRKFYDKDLKEAHTSHTMKTLKAKDPNTVLLKEMIKEYADIQNKNLDTISKTEKQNLFDDMEIITRNVTEDVHFKHLSRNIGSGKDKVHFQNGIPIGFDNDEVVDQDQNIDTMNSVKRGKFLKKMLTKREDENLSSTGKKRKSDFKSGMAKPNSVGRFEVFSNVILTPKPKSPSEPVVFKIDSNDDTPNYQNV